MINTDIESVGTLTSNAQIFDVLQKLSKRMVPLKMQVDSLGDRVFSTCIISTVPEQGIVELDVPPDAFPEDKRVNSKLTLQGEVDGIAMSFKTEFTAQPMHAKAPTCVAYRQRRADFRVHVGLGDEVSLLINTDNGSITGTVCDLSAGGLGFDVWFKIANNFECDLGDIFNDCVLQLGKKDTLKCSIKLCHIENDKPKAFHIGAEFIDLQPADKRNIRNHTMILEREQRRRSPISNIES